MKRFLILAVGWLMTTVGLHGDWFCVTLTREWEDLYRFEVKEICGFTRVAGQISSSNEKETFVKTIGEVTNLNLAGTIVTFEIHEHAFIFTSDRCVTLWTKDKEQEGVQNKDKFFIETREQTPLRKEKKSSFHFNFDNLKAEVETINHAGKSDFTVINPYNEHPWFSNEPLERMKFDEEAPKPLQKKKLIKNKDLKKSMQNKDFSMDDMSYFLRKK